jgi:hypothetical protein
MVTTDASAAPYEKGQLYQIPLTDLQADPNQPRGMVTAWNKVKEKQAKEEAGSQRKERTAPTPAAHREWVDKTNAKLTAIDSAAWTEEEKTAFAAALGELKKTILALLKTKPVIPT